MRDIVRYYTREAGVRSLEREISKICRKVVKSLVKKAREAKVTVNARNLDKYLGVRRYTFGMAEKQNQVGQVTGLAWTEVGGELLTIEAVKHAGQGQDDHHRQARRGDAGVHPGGALGGAQPLAQARHEGGLLPEERHPHPPARRRHAQGRAERRHRHLHAMVSVLTGIPVRPMWR
jgi:ATP-dependent Lon protease